jgi:hypothetical protein
LLPFPLMLVHFSLYPSQGLFNFIVYIFPKMTKRISRYKREGVGNPKRFMLAFRDSILSRGEETSRPRRRRSTLLSQNRALRSPSTSIPASSMETPNSQECRTPSCTGGVKLELSLTRIDSNEVLQEEEEGKDEDTKDEIRRSAAIEQGNAHWFDRTMPGERRGWAKASAETTRSFVVLVFYCVIFEWWTIACCVLRRTLVVFFLLVASVGDILECGWW